MAGLSFEESREGNEVDNLVEMEAPPTTTTGKGGPTINTEAVNSVMYSDIGINVLLNRLKQSIASARDFSSFLSKRARLEDEHAQGLKKLSSATLAGVRRQDGRQHSYAAQFAAVCGAHDRMADHGVQFANSLHQMHQDVDELTARIERERKHWKQEGTNTEKRVKDAELALEKAKGRYDSLAEDYDRVKTGGSVSGRVFTVKGPKSAEKHEEDLNRKVQAADTEYQSKVQTAQSTRQDNLNTWRPQAVKSIQELIHECDSALTLQLQKFAAFNEKLIVGNGLEVSPVRPESDPSRAMSMRDMVHQIDNDRDFHQYISSHANNVPSAPAAIAYQRHPIFGLSSQPPQLQTPTANKRQSFQQSPQTTQSPTFAAAQQPPLSFSTPSQPPQISTQAPSQIQTQAPTSSAPFHSSSPSSAGMGVASGYQQTRQQAPPDSFRSLSQQQYSTPSAAPVQPMNGSYGSSGPMLGSSGPLREPPRQATGPGAYSSSPSGPNGYGSAPGLGSSPGPGAGMGSMPLQQQRQQTQHQQLAPTKPVFGVSLDDIFRRDDTPIPYVVSQCTMAVEMFGLDVEGIYRLSGNASHVTQLKAVFDSGQTPDFRNPSSFNHDVNSVCGLLKQFLRQLPDPLFTAEHYTSFINAARLDNDDERRDAIHGVINALPDPNYATMRHLVLHLKKVSERAEITRMTEGNLAICFAPTLMGQHTGPQMVDAGLQARVVDTILRNTYQIFDED